MPDPVDFFIHIPKTAGSTLEHIIAEQYPVGGVLNLRRLALGEEEQVQRIRAMPPATRVVSGHLHYGYTAQVPGSWRAFTMLRDPIERVISLYYYIAREPRHITHEAFKRGKITMEKLAMRQGRVQACFLAGIAPKQPCPDDELLEQAKANLESNVTAFGLTERFDESLLLFNRALGWQVRGYVRQNVTKNRPTQDAIADRDLAVIRAHKGVDQELYDFAKSLFEQRIAAQPPGFAQELTSLRRQITVAQKVSWVRSSLGLLKRTLGLGN